MTEFHLVDLKPKFAEFKIDVLFGLSSEVKTLQPKYFYDERGSQLFDKICELEEYYPTRTEMKILDDHVDDIEAILEHPSSIIEYGSGSIWLFSIRIDQESKCISEPKSSTKSR